jgi:hypothetical protein
MQLHMLTLQSSHRGTTHSMPAKMLNHGAIINLSIHDRSLNTPTPQHVLLALLSSTPSAFRFDPVGEGQTKLALRLIGGVATCV